MEDKNASDNGVLGLDLIGNRPDVDKYGRPTELTFTSDPNIGDGAFTQSASSGTVTIKYDNADGSATVAFKGRLYVSGLTNPLVNSDLYARGGRLHTRG